MPSEISMKLPPGLSPEEIHEVAKKLLLQLVIEDNEIKRLEGLNVVRES